MRFIKKIIKYIRLRKKKFPKRYLRQIIFAKKSWEDAWKK